MIFVKDRFIKNILSLLFWVFCANLTLFSQTDGETLFKQNCTACHTIGGGRLVGPDLMGVTDKREAKWLKSWILNSQDLIASGDADAIAIFEEYNKVVMQSFDFSNQELDSLLVYIANPPAQEEVISNSLEAGSSSENSGLVNLLIIVLILVVLIFLLISIKNSLKEALGYQPETVTQTVVTQYELFISNNFSVLLVSFFLIIGGLKFTYDSLMGVGVTTNYQPAQPIEFSHKIHAGDNGIDCNYCHSSARTSKTAEVPSVNVCMNCHTMINKGAQYGESEIKKIHDAFENNIPIEWVRVHQLPDLTYFNHSQHVSVAGLECQQCHGNMEEKTLGQVATMEELNSQKDNVKEGIEFNHPTLTMGWCIDCHRQKEVNMEDNDYYTKMHFHLKEKHGDEKLTVDKLGGLECGKCHY